MNENSGVLHWLVVAFFAGIGWVFGTAVGSTVVNWIKGAVTKG